MIITNDFCNISSDGQTNSKIKYVNDCKAGRLLCTSSNLVLDFTIGY